MYSLSTIKNLNKNAVAAYFRDHPLKRILVPEDIRNSPDYSGGDIAHIERRFRVKEIDTLFVDSSGFGSPDEPALPFPAACRKVKEILDKNQDVFSALTGVGQFQVYVTLFKRKRKEN